MNSFKRLWQPIYQTHRGVSIMVSKSTVVAMMGCMGFGFAQFVHRFTIEIGSPFNPGYLTVFAVLVSIEAMYTQIRAADLDGKDKWIFRSAEILTLTILFKLFVLLRVGFSAMLVEISHWQSDFFSSFFSGEFISGGFILTFVWMVSTFLSSDIDDLHDREQDALWDELGKVQNALHIIRSRIMGYVFAMGAFVLFLSVGARLNLRAFVPVFAGRFDPTVPIVNVLLYFLLALVLLSQTQFALLRTRWLWSKTPVNSTLAKNWLIYGFIFFVGLAVLSFLLPTSYSLGFFQTLGYALNLLGEIFRFLISLILLPLTLCAQLFAGESEEPSLENLPPAASPPPPPIVEGSPSSLWQFIQSLLFWGTLLAVVIFALSQYIRANAFLFRRFTQLPFSIWLIKFARAVWSWLVGANRTVVTLIGAGLRRIRPPRDVFKRLERSLRRPGGRTTREQVIDIYLTLIELGQKFHPTRRSSETPYQYSRDMIGVHPAVSNEVLDLTEAFNEARYSDHPIQPETVPLLRKQWEQIRQALEKEEQGDSNTDKPGKDSQA